MVILLSVFGLGGTTCKVLTWCNIQRGITDDHEAHQKAVSEAVGRSWLKTKLRNFDRTVLQPMFVKKKMRKYSTDSTGRSTSVPGEVTPADVDVGLQSEEDHFAQQAREESEVGSYIRGGGGGVTLLKGSVSSDDRRGTESSGLV
jgi:hypothetical protein